ncbi:bifunctional glycosyltransferase family 2/GtrA family protein [Weissella koreensis]|uniref:bifunctional glycosyltransferase family 2/GtrA family protein n=1 Tax=Weissella koreensis TaxID=165096 RepID=UPI0022BA336F|nr:bifunctional glycosyltransferase family 2/GtrA family protein [Weissella koreensis]MCZ9311089.1 bifunctional glycosyltransferase family 2/GtrA family protein [Weissella koreensis]
MKNYSILIPAFNPDKKLISLIQDLISTAKPFDSILIVDDGSNEQKQTIFNQIQQMKYPNIHIMHHSRNLGKGAALKHGFKILIEQNHQLEGIATLDADGQHTVGALNDCLMTFDQNTNALVLGVRKFTNEIPLRSQFGNIITSKLVKSVTHQDVSDTQTGLRVIPKTYAEQLIEFDGDRFQFEFDMLLQAKSYGVKVVEQPIPTIYIDGNKSSHFRVIRDSLSIYSRFLKFAASGLISFLVDIILFELTILIFNNHILGTILVATVVSRLISAIVNYSLNHRVVFGKNGQNTMVKYGILFIIQMIFSGFMTNFVTNIIPHNNNFTPMFAKIIVDFTLFMISYRIQRDIIFKRAKED